MNAEQWIFVARQAVVDVVRSIDDIEANPALRHLHHGSSRSWASFDLADSGDVLWVAQVAGEAPAGSHVVATELGDMGVWRHPHDPTLPGLSDVVTPGALTELLRGIAHTVDVDPGFVEIVTLEPLQRATVRIGDIGRAAYVKVLPPWRVATMSDAHRRAIAGGVPSPPVLHVDVERGLVVLGALPGRPLAEHLELGLALPEPDAMWMLVERVAAAVGAHGDLHDRQILVDEAGRITGLVDLDDAGGDFLDDLADLVAHVTMRATTHPDQRERVGGYANDLLATFARHVDIVELQRRVERATARLNERRTVFFHDHSSVQRRTFESTGQ